MKKVEIKEGQTLPDILIQELGDMERLFEVALLNEMSVTDELAAGDFILVPESENSKKNIVKIFSDPANKPASGSTEGGAGDWLNVLEGIDYWAIQYDFIIS
jgi:hypothetical protein